MPKYNREKARLYDLKNGNGSCLSDMPATEFFGKWAKTHDPYATNLDEVEEFVKTPEGQKILKSVGIK